MSINDAIDIELERDLAELRAALARHPFPTCQDDLLALLAARQKPSRLLALAWHTCLPAPFDQSLKVGLGRSQDQPTQPMCG